MPSEGFLSARALTTAALVLSAGFGLVPALGQASLPGVPLGHASLPAPARATQCMACHGPGGVSQIPSMPSLAAQPRVFLENQLVLIREGLRDVPSNDPFLDGVPDTELTALARYFSAQPAPAVAKGPVDALSFERGQKLAKAALCGTCHLSSHQGRDQVPRMAGQQEQFLRDVMKKYRDHPGPGRDTTMAAALYGINDAQLKDLAHFFAHSP